MWEIENKPIDIDVCTFLKALFSNKEMMYLRRVHDKDKENNPAQNMQVEMQNIQSIIPTLQKYNKQNYGIFFVVNGNGHTDAEVKRGKTCKAQFMEIDDKPMKEQIAIINAFPLKPSIIVRTRKSLHCYWLLENGDIRYFRNLQQRLALYFNSDTSIKNESRTMRLPTFYHCKQEPIRVEVIHFEPQLKYKQKQLDEILPKLKATAQQKKQKSNTAADNVNSYGAGERVQRLISDVGTLKAKGISDEATKQSIIQINATMCNPPLTDAELEREVFPAIQRFATEELKPLPEERDKFHFFNDKGKPNGINHNAIAEDIKDKYNIFVCGIPYIYEAGVYKADYTGTRLKKFIKERIYPHLIKSQIVNQIYNLIVDSFELERDFESLNDYPKEWVNFKDCMYDAKNKQKMEHSPKYYAINQLPFSYEDVEKVAEGVELEKFLNFAIPNEENREMFLQYAGLCFTTDTRQQMSLLLCGVGGTGKSQLIKLLERALGEENTSNVGLQDLSKRFSTSLLVGKLLNSCSDLPLEAIEETGTFKKLVGEDKVFSERKGTQGFMFRNYSKLLFSTNLLPAVTGERNNAFYRRLLILKLDNIPSVPDTKLFEKLEKEILYFIKLCVEALSRMYANGIILNSKESQILVSQMQADSDTTSSFVAECCVIDAKASVDRGTLYNAYEKHCEDEDRQALSRNSFFKALRSKGFDEKRTSTNRQFIGICLEKVSQKTVTADGFLQIDENDTENLPFS